jgi:hypothetical protein
VQGQLAPAPINIIECQAHHFTGSQTEPGKQQQNRIIAHASLCLPLAMLEDLLYLARLEKLRHLGARPTWYTRHAGR